MVEPRPAPPIVASKDKSVADEGAAREQPNRALTKTMVLSRPAPARVSRPEDRGSYSATGNGCKSRHAVAIRRIVTPSITIAATLAALCPILAQPSESGSISSGHQIAITICGNCPIRLSARANSFLLASTPRADSAEAAGAVSAGR